MEFYVYYFYKVLKCRGNSKLSSVLLKKYNSLKNYKLRTNKKKILNEVLNSNCKLIIYKPKKR